MADPLDSIKAEGANPSPTSPGAPADAAAESWGARFKRLLLPWPKAPGAYVETAEAGWINGLLDDVTREPGLAAEHEVGESFALCLDALGLQGQAGLPPVVWVAWNGAKYSRAVYVQKRDRGDAEKKDVRKPPPPGRKR